MKTTLFLLLFAVITSGLSAQIEFAPKSAVWYYGADNGSQYHGEQYAIIQYDHDTTIKGVKWKVLKQINYNVNKQAFSTGKYVIRQDSTIVKIWMDTFANVLYNFNMHVHDTITYIDTAKNSKPYNIYKIFLDSIGIVTISGNKRKIFYCEEVGFSFSGNIPLSFIEGIGRTAGFLPWQRSQYYPHLDEFRCYSDSVLNYHNNIYPFSVIGCDSIMDYTGIKANYEENKNIYWLASPNPSNGLIALGYHGDEKLIGLTRGEMYSMTGQKLFDFAIPAGQEEKQLDISSMPCGIYLIKITWDQGASILKIIKQ